MSYTLDWDNTCVILRVDKNEADYHDILSLFDRLSADPCSDSARGLIFDFSKQGSLELTLYDLKRIAAIVAVPLLNYMRSCRRIAFLASSQQVESVLHSYIDNFSRTGIEKRVFTDEDSARIWLSEESQT